MAEGPEMSDADVAEGVFGTGRCRKLETSPVVARIAARKAPLENRGVPALRSASLPDAVPGRFQYAGSFSVSRRFVPRLFGRDSVLRSAADRGRHGDNSRSAVSVSRSSDEAAVSFRMSMSKVRVRYGVGISMRWCEVPGRNGCDCRRAERDRSHGPLRRLYRESARSEKRTSGSPADYHASPFPFKLGT